MYSFHSAPIHVHVHNNVIVPLANSDWNIPIVQACMCKIVDNRHGNGTSGQMLHWNMFMHMRTAVNMSA